MEERGSKEKVIQAINDYLQTILHDFLEEVQTLTEKSKPLFDSTNNERLISSKLKSSTTAKRFKNLLDSISQNEPKIALRAFSEFIRTEDEYDEYWELYGLYRESFEKITNLSIEYNFMISALNFTKL